MPVSQSLTCAGGQRTKRREPITLSGPRLADVLKTAGCADVSVFTVALDGFATKIPAEQVAWHAWVLATRADGRPHSIGGRGPLWLMFGPARRPPGHLRGGSLVAMGRFFMWCG